MGHRMFPNVRRRGSVEAAGKTADRQQLLLPDSAGLSQTAILNRWRKHCVIPEGGFSLQWIAEINPVSNFGRHQIMQLLGYGQPRLTIRQYGGL